MKKNPLSFLKTFSLGLKDGLLILVVLAAISPFVYREVLHRTSSNSDVVTGSVGVTEADLPIRPSTSTPVAPTATPRATLMPTPTLQPTESPTTTSESNESSSHRPVDGGFITLHIEGLREGLWTQVQWLAGDGNWYDVNGWAGHLTANNDVLWFVGKDHLGAEPAFRWLVYDAEGGSLLATSDEFHLPTDAKQTVNVAVSVPAQ